MRFIKCIKFYIRKMMWIIRGIVAEKNYPFIKNNIGIINADEFHLQAVINWLCLAQDVTQNGGVSAYYDLFEKKWGQAYRETTGYIIETFLDYYNLTCDQIYFDRAKKMGEWELSVQCDDGAFGELMSNGLVGKKIFNTGQVILGLCRLYEVTSDSRYLSAIIKASDWLVKNQEINGSWDEYTTQGPKTYHSRVAWALLIVWKITENEKYLKSAKLNINWVIGQQNKNYWFDNTSLSEKNEPWTHLIVYTISGLIECYLLLGSEDRQLFDSFYGSAEAILNYYQKHHDNYLPCSFNKDWLSQDWFTCLTGDAQLAIVWMQIYKLTGENKFLENAHRIIDQVKKTQINNFSFSEISGGIFGSYPIGGDYAPYKVLNWSAKFFADALILKNKIKT